MRLALTIGVTLLVLAACSGDDSTPEAVWFDMHGIAEFETHEGQQVGISNGTIYVYDCALARQLTETGAPFGPTERDEQGNYEPGYGFACSE